MWKKHDLFKLILFIPIVLLLSSCFKEYSAFNYYKDGPLSDLYKTAVIINKEVGINDKSAEILKISAKSNKEEIERENKEFSKLKDVFVKRLKAEYDISQIEIPYEYKGEISVIKITGIEFSDIQFINGKGKNDFDILLSVRYEITGDLPPYDFLRIELINPQNHVFASYNQLISKEGITVFPLKADMSLSYLQKIHIY